MTKYTQYTFHALSLVLMVLTIQLGYWVIGTETMRNIFFLLGCFIFGVRWGDLTFYLMDKYEANT